MEGTRWRPPPSPLALAIVGASAAESETTLVGLGVGTLLSFNLTERPDTSIRIVGIRFADAWQAVRFDCGKRPAAPTARTVVSGNKFRRIGAKHVRGARAAYSAVGVRGCRGSIIAANDFDAVENPPDNGPELIHAIYLAHGASSATVEGNSFARVSGAAIKLRDASGDATIRSNSFSAVGVTGAVQRWFCDVRKVRRCAVQAAKDKHTECPSRCNVLNGNSVDAGYLGNEIELLQVSRPGEGPSQCPRPTCSSGRTPRE